MQNPVIRRVTDPNDSAMPAVRSIYESQLPACERKPTAWLDEVVQQADYALTLSGNANGFAIVFTPMQPTDAALLEYLAINESQQGRGIGTMLVQAIPTSQPLLVEVEASDEPNAVRRRSFYHRLGFQQLKGLPYLMPLNDAPAMELMLCNGPAALNHQTMARWLKTIYKSVYHCDPNDPRLAFMLENLPAF